MTAAEKPGNRSEPAIALICGGRSERMGEAGDKAFLPWPPPEGPPLYEAQLTKLAAIQDNNDSPVFLSCRADQARHFVRSGARIILDPAENRGPIAGLVSCLRES